MGNCEKVNVMKKALFFGKRTFLKKGFFIKKRFFFVVFLITFMKKLSRFLGKLFNVFNNQSKKSKYTNMQ